MDGACVHCCGRSSPFKATVYLMLGLPESSMCRASCTRPTLVRESFFGKQAAELSSQEDVSSLVANTKYLKNHQKLEIAL